MANTCSVDGPVCLSSRGIFKMRSLNNGSRDSNLSKLQLNQIAKKSRFEDPGPRAIANDDQTGREIHSRYSQKTIYSVQSLRKPLTLKHHRLPLTLPTLPIRTSHLGHQGLVWQASRLTLPPLWKLRKKTMWILRYRGSYAHESTIGDTSTLGKSVQTLTKHRPSHFRSEIAGLK